MKRLYKKYYTNTSANDLIELIDCFENILYHSLLDYDVDYKYYFFEDINLRINTENMPSYNPNNLRLNDGLFNIITYNLEAKEAIQMIERLVDQEIIVAFCTMFDMLPPYTWYKQEDKIGKSNTHYCIVVGYDDQNLYIVDSPTMLNEERTIRYSGNETVLVLNKTVLLDAFKIYCRIVSVTVNVDMLNLSYQDHFEAIRTEVVQNYLNNNNNVGRCALKQLIEDINDNIAMPIIMKDYFWIYLMHARRTIFKLCLLDIENNYKNKDKIIQYLDEDIICWKLLYGVIAKHVCKSNPKINDVVINLLDQIINIEDKLIDLIHVM